MPARTTRLVLSLTSPSWTCPSLCRTIFGTTIRHANVVLAYTKDNLAHLMYPGGVTRQDWAHDLPRLVNESW